MPTRQFLVPTDAIAFVPLSPKRDAQPSLSVHGYRLYLVKRSTPVEPWDAYDVPQLEVQITLHGKLAHILLDTLGPSARYVALSGGRGTPRPSRAFEKDGVSLSIPLGWHVGALEPVIGCASPAPADLPDLTVVKPVERPSEPLGGTGQIGHVGATGPTRPAGLTGPGAAVMIGPSCTPGPPSPTTTASNGLAPTDLASLYLDARDDPFNQWYHSVVPGLSTTPGQPITTLHHGATTIVVWAAPYAPNILDVFFRHDGSSTVHALTLGLGRDGRVAAGVLASIKATA